MRIRHLAALTAVLLGSLAAWVGLARTGGTGTSAHAGAFAPRTAAAATPPTGTTAPPAGTAAPPAATPAASPGDASGPPAGAVAASSPGAAPAAGSSTKDRPLPPLFDQLNLTPDQLAQVKSIEAETDRQLKAEEKAIRDASLTRIKAVLTPEQQSRLASLEATARVTRSGEIVVNRYRSLNLTDDQKAKIRALAEDEARRLQTASQAEAGPIRKQMSDQINAVLTPEQKQKFDADRAARKARQSQGSPSGAAAPPSK